MRPLHASHHTIIILESMHDDLLWWDNFLSTFNGKTLCAPISYWVRVYADASHAGSGMAWGNGWAFMDWESEVPEDTEAHINIKEILADGDCNMVNLVSHLPHTSGSRTILRLFSQRCGEGTTKYGPHSLQCCGVTWALHCDLSAEAIRLLGDLRSDAYKDYLEMSPDLRSSYMHQLMSKLPLHATWTLPTACQTIQTLTHIHAHKTSTSALGALLVGAGCGATGWPP